MTPLDGFGPQSFAADLFQQVRRCNGVSCPRCCADRAVKNGSYGHFQRYLCKNCNRTFNDNIGTIFARSKIALRKWLFSIYAFLRSNTNLCQLQLEIDAQYNPIYQRVELFTKTLDGPSLPSFSLLISTKFTSLRG